MQSVQVPQVLVHEWLAQVRHILPAGVLAHSLAHLRGVKPGSKQSTPHAQHAGSQALLETSRG